MDEPKYTKAQIRPILLFRIKTLTGDVFRAERIVDMILRELDPPARTCRCGKFIWHGDFGDWFNNEKGQSVKPGVDRDTYLVCVGCRCALLKEGKVSFPLSDHMDFVAFHAEDRTLYAPRAEDFDDRYLRDRPISAAPDRTES